jgi:4-amino-4-deoxy-L-arabinose transferase-like glycosyltransferase
LYDEAAAVGQLGMRAHPGGGDQSHDREWHLHRLGNVALVAPLPLVGWATARRLGGGVTEATAAAVVPLAIPQLAFIGSSINNDNLLVLLSGLIAVGVAGVVRGDLGRWTAFGIGLAIALALWTKAFAIVYLPWVGLAYGFQVTVDRSRLRRCTEGLAIAWGTATVAGCWWWVRNQMRHGEAFPSVLNEVLRRRTPGFEPDIVEFTRTYVPTMVHRFWGDFTSARLSPNLVILATVAMSITAIAAFAPRRVRPARSKAPATGLELAVFASVLVILGGLLFYLAYDLHRFSGAQPFMQGRYLFGAIVPIMVVVGFGAARLVGRWAPLALLAIAMILHLDGVRVMLRDLWAEPDASIGRSIEAAMAWSPWVSAALPAMAVVTVTTLGLTTFTLLRDARRPAPVLEERPSERRGLVIGSE